MGYTYYFRGLTATSKVVAEARKIIEASGVTICGPRGEGLPILSDTHGIKLNGFAAAGEAYLTLSPPSATGPGHPNPVWFCTTENKPYDLVVTAILTAAALHSPGYCAATALGKLDSRHRPIRKGRTTSHPGPKDHTRTRHRSHASRSSLTPEAHDAPAVTLLLSF